MAVGLVTTLVIIIPRYQCELNICSSSTKDLSNAKTIYLGLKVYALDNGGRFPDTRSDGTKPVSNANEVFENLIPNYIPNKTPFYSKGSAWTPRPPNNEDLTPQRLLAGENHFAYVLNLTDNSNPDFPLVADGFVEGKPGVYTLEEGVKGSIKTRNRSEKSAIVIRVDGSGKLEAASKSPDGFYRLLGPTVPNASKADLFAPAANWLRPDQTLLNPAVDLR